ASRINEACLMIVPLKAMRIVTSGFSTYEFNYWGDGEIVHEADTPTKHAARIYRHPYENLGGYLNIPHDPAGGGADFDDAWVRMRNLLHPLLQSEDRRSRQWYRDNVWDTGLYSYYKDAPYYPVWSGKDPFFRQEMGRDWAKDPPVHVGI